MSTKQTEIFIENQKEQEFNSNKIKKSTKKVIFISILLFSLFLLFTLTFIFFQKNQNHKINIIQNNNQQNLLPISSNEINLQLKAEKSNTFSAVYDVQDSEVKIKLYDISYTRFQTGIESMEVDGETKNGSSFYKFNTIGLHYITFKLNRTLPSMELMFKNCSSLLDVDLSGLDTSNITSMAHMFYGCSSLENIDFGNIDTSKVTKMEGMFNGCSNLESVDLSNFDTSLVLSFGSMFSKCTSLKYVDLSNFKTDKLNFISFMFYKCSSLTEIDISGFDTKNVNTLSFVFLDIAEGGKITYNPNTLSERIIAQIPSSWTKNEK